MKVKPLEWKKVGRSEVWFAETVEGTVSVYLDYLPDRHGTAWHWSGSFTGEGPDGGPFDTADEAKAAVERWHAARVMEWLEPTEGKRYLLFAGAVYYPDGGWKDYQCGADTVEEAEAARDRLTTRDRGMIQTAFEWAEIVDTATNTATNFRRNGSGRWVQQED